MQDHFDLSDTAFKKAFQNGSFPPHLFNHEAHIRLAWIHIKNEGIDQAVTNICEQIKAFAISSGATDKYNETVTIAAVKAVYYFMLKSNMECFQEFILEYPRLKFNFKDLLAQHYGIDIFNDAFARSSFLQPDLLPFD